MENITIKANADIFIIPNKAAKLYDFICNADRIENTAKTICENLGQKFNPWGNLVEIWMTSKDLETENLTDHGANIKIEGEEYYILPGTIASFVPSNIIRGLKEGDAIDILYKDVEARSSKDKIYINLIINATAKQKSYRYSNFGTFEKVLEKVCK